MVKFHLGVQLRSGSLLCVFYNNDYCNAVRLLLFLLETSGLFLAAESKNQQQVCFPPPHSYSLCESAFAIIMAHYAAVIFYKHGEPTLHPLDTLQSRLSMNCRSIDCRHLAIYYIYISRFSLTSALKRRPPLRSAWIYFHTLCL